MVSLRLQFNTSIMKSTGKSHKSTTGKSSSASESRKDRKSSSGLTGSPKKGGHGGKFTWIGSDHLQIGAEHGAALDSKDPNFEDHEEIIVADADTVTAAVTV